MIRIPAEDIDGPRLPAVYQLVGSDGTILYVGYSASVRGRLREHRAARHWWPEVDHVLISFYGTAEEGRAAEAQVTAELQPKYDVRLPGTRRDESLRARELRDEQFSTRGARQITF